MIWQTCPCGATFEVDASTTPGLGTYQRQAEQDAAAAWRDEHTGHTARPGPLGRVVRKQDGHQGDGASVVTGL